MRLSLSGPLLTNALLTQLLTARITITCGPHATKKEMDMQAPQLLPICAKILLIQHVRMTQLISPFKQPSQILTLMVKSLEFPKTDI